ncbi:MAG: hypothetical protein OXP71_04485 [Candidatus Poribacteria bacterium]|nr:hypothetical protein [Candidatus Poribacteria bacterium]
MKNRLQYASVFVATALMLVAFTASAANEVQNLAVVVNGLRDLESLSIVDLDEPDVEQAVENEIIPLGSAPRDIEIRGDVGYVVNTWSHNLQVIDIRNRVSVGTIRLGDNTEPQEIAFVSDSKAYVTCSGTNDIRVVDVNGRSVINTIPGGLKPTGITIINDKAYVTNSAWEFDGQVTYKDSSVTVIDIRTDTILTTIDVPTNATGITNDGESKVVVITTGDYATILGNLVIIDANRDEVEKVVKLRSTPAHSLVINSMNHAFFTGGDGWFTNLGLMIYDLERQKWIRDRNDALADFAGGSGIAIDENDNIYVAVPDWTGARLDELRVMAPDETLDRTYRVGPGASHVAIARIQPLEPPPVDVNSDGVVDVADLVLVAGNFGQTGAAGDINSDGVIDISDLVLVAKRFGEDVAAAPPYRQLRSVNAAVDTAHIQRAITELESYPDQSPIIRFIADYLRAYLTSASPTVLKTELLANFPNPFNPETWMPYHLARAADVTLTIYDKKGAVVRELNVGHQPAGLYADTTKAAYWDGKSETGELVSSGVYFYQLRAGDYSQVRRMAILK